MASHNFILTPAHCQKCLYPVLLNQKWTWRRKSERLQTGFQKSSGHRQLLWLTSGETRPGVNISKCWKAAGPHGGSFIGANSSTCLEHHGSQRSRANSANKQTELSPSSHVSKYGKEFKNLTTLQFCFQIKCFCICSHAAVGVFTIY